MGTPSYNFEFFTLIFDFKDWIHIFSPQVLREDEVGFTFSLAKNWNLTG